MFYATRLRWANGSGVAKLHGKAVALAEPPILLGAPVHGIDYTPEVACFEVWRTPWSGASELTAEEIKEADKLLVRLVNGPAPAGT